METRDDQAKNGMGDNMVKPIMLKFIPTPPPPIHQRLRKKNMEEKFKNFISILKLLSIILHLIDVLEQMHRY